MYFRTILCTLLVGFAAATYYETCDSKSGKVTSVSVTNCDSNPCILKVGTKPEVTIGFNSLVKTQKVTVEIDGVIANVPIPFPQAQNNGCVNSGLDCPLSEGKSYTYKNSFEILSSYPQISVTVEYKLKDDNNNNIVCVKIPSKIEA